MFILEKQWNGRRSEKAVVVLQVSLSEVFSSVREGTERRMKRSQSVSQ